MSPKWKEFCNEFIHSLRLPFGLRQIIVRPKNAPSQWKYSRILLRFEYLTLLNGPIVQNQMKKKIAKEENKQKNKRPSTYLSIFNSVQLLRENSARRAAIECVHCCCRSLVCTAWNERERRKLVNNHAEIHFAIATRAFQRVTVHLNLQLV